MNEKKVMRLAEKAVMAASRAGAVIYCNVMFDEDRSCVCTNIMPEEIIEYLEIQVGLAKATLEDAKINITTMDA